MLVSHCAASGQYQGFCSLALNLCLLHFTSLGSLLRNFSFCCSLQDTLKTLRLYLGILPRSDEDGWGFSCILTNLVPANNVLETRIIRLFLVWPHLCNFIHLFRLVWSTWNTGQLLFQMVVPCYASMTSLRGDAAPQPSALIWVSTSSMLHLYCSLLHAGCGRFEISLVSHRTLWW